MVLESTAEVTDSPLAPADAVRPRLEFSMAAARSPSVSLVRVKVAPAPDDTPAPLLVAVPAPIKNVMALPLL